MLKKILMSFVAIILVISTLFTCSATSFAEQNNEAKKYDLVFLFDTSKSVENIWQVLIKTIRDKVKEFDVSSTDYRVAVVEFRTTTSTKNYKYKSSEFMTGSDNVFAYLDKVQLSNSNFSSSSLFSALIDGTKDLTFRHDAVRALFVMGTTDCTDPEEKTGYDFAQIKNRFSLSDNDTTDCPYRFYTYNFGNNAGCEKYYKLLAEKSGGKYTALSKSSVSDFETKFNAALGNDMNTVRTLNVIETKQTFIEIVEAIISKTNTPIKAVLKVFVRLYKMIIGN